MQPIDFKDKEPRLVLEEYFQGEVRAWGIFEDRFGKLRRQFTVNITGSWDGRILELDEQFLYDDGEEDQRLWIIEKIDDHSYSGHAEGVIGKAKGTAYGNALNWQYDIDLQMGGRKLQVHFDDWLFLQADNVLLNRARVTKWGIEIGEVTLVFLKAPVQAARPEDFTEDAKPTPVPVFALGQQ